MNNLLNYILPFLKFGAIFFSALSGGMGLLVDFKKEGRITKWGKRALLGVVISFLIAATTQAIEVYRNKQSAIVEEKKTQKMLFEISRGIYGIDATKLSFDLRAEIDLKNKYFEKYYKRVFNILIKYQTNSNYKLPKGAFEVSAHNVNGRKERSFLFVVKPESPLYPNSKFEKDVFSLIGQTALDISIYKADSLCNSVPVTNKTPNLTFATNFATPEIMFNISDTTITMSYSGLQSDLEDYTRRNTGGIESLLDLSNGLLRISLSDRIIDNLNDAGVDISKSYYINCLSFNVNNRRFSSCDLCKTINRWTTYYLKLPEDILQSHLDIDCQK